mgnify:CR=1 FL=1
MSSGGMYGAALDIDALQAADRVAQTAGDRVTLHCEVAPDLVFAGAREDLEEMLGNLVEHAAKYGGGSLTAEQLATSIRSGSSGKWGSVPMPAQPQVNQADLISLSTWILQQGKQ